MIPREEMSYLKKRNLGVLIMIALCMELTSGCGNPAENLKNAATEVSASNSTLSNGTVGAPDGTSAISDGTGGISEGTVGASILSNQDEPTASEKEPHIIPIIVDGMLLGGYYDGQWLESSDAASKMDGSEVYKVFSEYKLLGEAKGSKPTLDEELGERYEVGVGRLNDSGYNSIDIGNADYVKSIEPSTSDKSIYSSIAEEFLKENGKNGSLYDELLGYSADIDGDGETEYIISINYFDGKDDLKLQGWYREANNFSYLFLSKKADNGYETTIIADASQMEADSNYADIADIEEGTLMVFRSLYHLEGLIDITGDGKAELFCREDVHEGVSYIVFEYRDGKYAEVLSAGYGN
jgi:hypothetical protein